MEYYLRNNRKQVKEHVYSIDLKNQMVHLQFKNQLDSLKKIDFNRYGYKKIIEIVNNLIFSNNIIYPNIYLPNILYRGRPINSYKDIQSKKDLSYPPIEYVTSMGRLNNKQESIF